MRIVLVSGAPGAGKLYLAHQIAVKLQIYRLVSTDTVREVMRAALPKKDGDLDREVLHTSAILAPDLRPEHKDDPIWGFLKQAEVVKPGVEAVIRRSIKEKESLVLEGIHLLPGEFEFPPEVEWTHFVIKASDEARYKKQIGRQGNERAHYKLEHLDRALAFQDYLEAEAKKRGIQVITNSFGDVISQLTWISKYEFGDER
jgi:2-phosphoglycerate kinase